MKKVFSIEGIDCAACASKLESKISKIDGITSANLNFFASKLTIEYDNEDCIPILIKTVKKQEPDAEIKIL